MRQSLVVSMVGLALVAGACSSSSSPSSSPSPTADSYCAQAQAVKDSFSALIDTDVVAEGTDSLTTRFDAFMSDLESLKTAAGSGFSGEIDALQSSVDQLKTVVDNADTAGAAATATAFVAGLDALKTSAQALFTAVDQACQT